MRNSPPPDNVVRLETVRSVQLPADFAVRAVLLGDGGSLVVAAHNKPVLFIDSLGRTSADSTPLAEGFLGIQAGPCKSCASLLIDSGGTLREVGVPGQQTTAVWRSPQEWRGNWMSAAAMGSGWAVGGLDSAGRLALLILDRSAPARLVCLSALAETIQGTGSRRYRAVRVSPAGRAILASLAGPPHTSFVIDSAGLLVMSLRPVAAESAGGTATPRVLLSAGVVKMGEAYLQVLADPASDRRHLLIFNSHGTQVAARQLDAPWGPAAARENQALVVAFLAVTPPELVIYRWHWLRSF